MITFASWITLTRIFLTPFIVYSVLMQNFLSALILFIVAAATDLLDGYVARVYNQQTVLGQLLDPIADKCLIMATLYALLLTTAHGFLQTMFVYFLLAKELILLVGGTFLKLKYDFFIQPSRLSRTASFSEIFLIVFLFVSVLFFKDIPSAFFMFILGGNVLFSVWLLLRYAKIVAGIIKK